MCGRLHSQRLFRDENKYIFRVDSIYNHCSNNNELPYTSAPCLDSIIMRGRSTTETKSYSEIARESRARRAKHLLYLRVSLTSPRLFNDRAVLNFHTVDLP